MDLTAKEFDLLSLFITNRGKIFDRNTLLSRVWKHQGDLRTVDVHIRRLREKLNEIRESPSIYSPNGASATIFLPPTRTPGPDF